MDIRRTADQAGIFGTIVFHALLVFLIMLLMVKCNNETPPDPLDGAVAVSIGEPENGGPDESTAEVEESSAQPTESSTEETVSSDVSEAPEVQQTQNRPSTTTTTTPTPNPPKPRTADPRNSWKPGSGTGSGSGTQSGDQGKPDGTENGSPDGTGGTGSGGIGESGDGWSGNIDGFKVKVPSIPVNTQQEFGKVTVIVCVDRTGKVVDVRPGGRPTTNTSKHLENLSINAAKKFTFTRIGTATEKNCGYITFHYIAG